MFKNLATIVEVFGDRVLSLVGLRPMCNHRTMVAAGNRNVQKPLCDPRPSYDCPEGTGYGAAT